MTEKESEALEQQSLRWTFDYVMADYDRDHFVMRGAHPARCVRAMADWVEAEMAREAGFTVDSRRPITIP